MSRDEKGSKRHIRWYANEGRAFLNAALSGASSSLGASASGDPVWVSPLAEDGYEECWNERFLERLDLLDDHLGSFRDFWPFRPWVGGRINPRGTPHWDALARVPLRAGGFGVVMVEAKAHRSEFVKPNDKSGAQPDALRKIKTALAAARDYYGVSATAPAWESRYYQVTNRFAHLHWMNEVVKVPTWLVWMFIVDDRVWPDRLSASEWYEAFETVKSEVGVPGQHPLDDRVVAVYLPAAPETARATRAASERTTAPADPTLTPRAHHDRREIERKQALLNDPHIAPLTHFVRRLRAVHGPDSVPWFDPTEAGVEAPILLLFENPGRRADVTQGSGFISADNDDRSADNTWHILREAGIDRRRDIAAWNIVPWYLGDERKIGKVSMRDLDQARPALLELLDLLPRLRVVVLFGRVAQRGWERARAPCSVVVLQAPHTSGRWLNGHPEDRTKIVATLHEARRIAGLG